MVKNVCGCLEVSGNHSESCGKPSESRHSPCQSSLCTPAEHGDTLSWIEGDANRAVQKYKYVGKHYGAPNVNVAVGSVMIERDCKAWLAQEILAGTDDGFSVALKLVDGMSISHVKEALEEYVAPADSALCHRFIEQWLERFEPVQRLAAALEVSDLYVLDLVDVPHAEDLILLRTLENGADALEALKSEVFSYREVARNPDASFGPKFVKTVEAETGAPLAEAIERLRSNAERLGALIRRAYEEA